MDRSIYLPLVYAEDRIARDLNTGDYRRSGNRMFCVVTDEIIEDMIDDAEYQGWYTDFDDKSVVMSARRANAALLKYRSLLT